VNAIEKLLMDMTAKKMIDNLKLKEQNLLKLFQERGAYIFGTGRLGNFAYEQCIKQGYVIKGYIDNNSTNWNNDKHIYSPDILKSDDVIIVASYYFVDIMKQLYELNIINVIYYEKLSIILEELDTYSEQVFKILHSDLELNKNEYIKLYDILQDDISKDVFENMIRCRMFMDTSYSVYAMNLSLQNGVQYFDKIITENTSIDIFYDVGGYDGDSTIDFIKYFQDYKKVYFFEPDQDIINNTKKRLIHFDNIEYLQAVVGERREKLKYNALGGGAGLVDKNGNDIVNSVILEDYIDNDRVYVKMDIEGYESQAIRGMKSAIQKYQPILAISVYHKADDIHRLVNEILSINPKYKVYMRHYKKNLADTVCYFI